jgi:hypothetical protein
MRFVVPQFIEKETSLIGPLTFRQFVYIGGGGGTIGALYYLLAGTHFGLFIIATIFVGAFALALAFYKVQGQDLPAVLQNFFVYSLRPKIYIWKKKHPIMYKAIERKPIEKEAEPQNVRPMKRAGEGRQIDKLRTYIETK